MVIETKCRFQLISWSSINSVCNFFIHQVNRRSIFLFASLYLFLQEFRQRARMIEDFTSFTGGFLTDFDGARVHNINCDIGESTSLNFACYHGFGANCLSWSPIIDRFPTYFSNCKISAHDIPGFGYSVRNTFENIHDICYTPEWSASVGHLLNQPSEDCKTYICIGHSMGSLSAIISAALICRDLPVTLILESPALFHTDADISRKYLSKGHMHSVIDDIHHSVLMTRHNKLNTATTKSHHRKLSSELFLSFLTFPLRVLIRRILSFTRIWRIMLSLAWFNKALLSKAIIHNYQLPVTAIGFELDLLRFLFLSTFTRPTIMGHSYIDILRALVNEGCNVLIIHGKNDQIVPLSNSLRIAQLVPEVVLQTVENCGHVCHEEKPDTFLSLINAAIL